LKPSPAPQRGFTLLEVLVAFVILALSLGVIMQIFSTGMGNLSLGDEYSRATLYAQSRLAALGAEEPLAAGQTSGDFGDGYRWRVTVSPYDLPPSNRTRTDAGLGGNLSGELLGLGSPLSNLPVQAFSVVVEVTWAEGGQERAVALQSLRLGPAPSG
jgi:general secretion pathway protein I